MKDDRGQLRSYFNASPTVKLGVLTDGLKYEFYADSDKPNMMDDTAFLRVDLADIARDASIDDNTLGDLPQYEMDYSIRKMLVRKLRESCSSKLSYT